jgi:hypothetical protein
MVISFGVINDLDILHVSRKFHFIEKYVFVLIIIDDILISTSYLAQTHVTATIRSLQGRTYNLCVTASDHRCGSVNP